MDYTQTYNHISMQTPFSGMTVLDVPLQSHFLYNGKWNAKVDAKLLDSLLDLKAELGWEEDDTPTFFLMAAAREIHNMCGAVFNVPELETHVKLFMLRYQTFNEVITSKGTY